MPSARKRSAGSASCDQDLHHPLGQLLEAALRHRGQQRLAIRGRGPATAFDDDP